MRTNAHRRFVGRDRAIGKPAPAAGRLPADETARVAAALRALYPSRHPTVQTLIQALAREGYAIGSADEVAAQLGLANRFALNRLLTDERLPELRKLKQIAYLLGVFARMKRDGLAPSAQRLADGKNPTYVSALAHGLLGRTLTDLRGLGWQWLVGELARRDLGARRGGGGTPSRHRVG